MDSVTLLATVQGLVQRMQGPEGQAFVQRLVALADLLHDEAALIDRVARLTTDLHRAEAESASRQRECQEQEAATRQRTMDAATAGQHELATLHQTRTQLQTEITALFKERREIREVIQQAHEEQSAVLTTLRRERSEATRALEAARSMLTKLRETIPA